MTEAEFIKEIQDEITGSGSLPAVLNQNEIKRVIRQAEMYFSDRYQYSVQKQHYILKKSVFKIKQFRKSRTIRMPDNVVSVVAVKEINGIGRLGTIDPDFAENRLLASEIFISSFLGDDLVMRTAQGQFFDLSKSFFIDKIRYDFNKNSKQLKIEGRDPRYDVMIDTWTKIPLDKLYDDYYFLRYCTAKCKISYGRILGAYQYQLPGEVQINAEMFKSEGEEEVQWILEQIQEEDVMDWMIIYN
ncbi:MAG: hypothetical protein BWY04_01550 [candidate division CPR1 bacterium ADurb.Bin160]|uniref:Uncharacterized protein n=1 Tax=candidate division CPR1 bacterium ADurb.Bin160 TaxID=1852826 RepID=A0A1V5ZHL4_9BACT|nr:MAG: hypothetical protein BWY04_01550 [candidate division CPR1 bacterium ADurb.Bin160]